MNYDIIFVGAGTANVFACLELLTKKSDLKILMVDKGNDPYNRKSNEVVAGFLGAGMFSDAKIILSPEIGGSIKEILPNETLKYLEDRLLNHIKTFYPREYEIINPPQESISKYPPFRLTISPTLHLGTDYGRKMGIRVWDYLKDNGVELKCLEEVVDILKVNGEFEIVTNKKSYKSKKVVFGTGKSGVNLTKDIIHNFKLQTKYKLPQMGMRVEVPYEITKELTDKYYDFKLKLIEDNGEARSFCVSPRGEVIIEKQYGGFTYNGGSSKDIKTNFTNWGIMYTPKNNISNSFEYQKKFVLKCNKYIKENKSLNFDEFVLLYKKIFKNTYEDMYNTIINWCTNFDNICFGFVDNVRIYLPEVKYSPESIVLDGNFMTPNCDGLFIVGDSSIARGIYQSALSGIHVGSYLAN